ncbi:DUF6907 domain-containing protein [Kitasatospora aureofaciens]|uniref:DUF6907 domain-containing protein n=1 Tax=Kitasatospora aureofaciens TaxID=1894 RepID=UPI00382D1511
MSDASTPTITSHHAPAGFTPTSGTRPTHLVAVLREGLTPTEIHKDPDGGYTACYDPRAFDRDAVNVMLDALGIPPSRPIEEIHAEAAAKVQALVDAELAERPGGRTVDVAIWGGGTMTVPEPVWCTREHEAGAHPEHPQDIYHSSTEVTVNVARPDGTPLALLSGWIADNPYSANAADVGPRGVIWFGSGDCEDYRPAGLDRLAHELRAAAAWVDGLRAQLLDALTEAGR